MDYTEMIRRSPRLLTNGYYNPNGHTRQINYRENPVRIFRPRRRRRVDRVSRNLMNEFDMVQIPQNQEIQETPIPRLIVVSHQRISQSNSATRLSRMVFRLVLYLLMLDACFWFSSLFIMKWTVPPWGNVSPYALSQSQAALHREVNLLRQNIAQQKWQYERLKKSTVLQKLEFENEINSLKHNMPEQKRQFERLKQSTAMQRQACEENIRMAFSRLHADHIGMADYALESIGANVIASSETHKTIYCKLFGFTMWCKNNGPETAIQPEVYPGKCWPFKGSRGHLVISLPYPVPITHVTLEHLPRVLAPTGDIRSAPREFAVYGMMNEKDEGKPLGVFTYDQDGEPIQTFKILNSPGKVYRMVKLRILSNWGHPEYTCVYRFRVHSQTKT